MAFIVLTVCLLKHTLCSGSGLTRFRFGQTYMYAVVLKDDQWSIDFVPFGSFSHNVLSLLHSSLREQPTRRFWDEPASDLKREAKRFKLDQRGLNNT